MCLLYWVEDTVELFVAVRNICGVIYTAKRQVRFGEKKHWLIDAVIE
jgi:hypothetical protein